MSAVKPAEPALVTEKAPINWVTTLMFVFTTLPLFTVLPWYLWTHDVSGWAWFWGVAFLYANGIGITAGYHRLWAHRSYKAHPILKVGYALFGGMAIQNSILIWASMHRIHHQHVDHVDKDPYSAQRGLWYSHIGWMLRDYPSSELDFENARDLKDDKIVMWQHRNYLALILGMNIGLPVLLGLAYGDLWGFVLIAGFLRLVVNHHVTFFINSLAHFWGRQPYTTTNSARDNDFLAFLTYGEGYHNYHHLFQYDYRNGIRWWHYDPTKWLIAACSWLGLAKDLKRVPDFKIKRAMLQAQFERAREKLALSTAANSNRLNELQHLLEHEWQQFSSTVAEWTRLQSEKFDTAKQQLSDKMHERMHEAQAQWEHSEMRQKLVAMERKLEESLELQRQRVQLLRTQMAYA